MNPETTKEKEVKKEVKSVTVKDAIKNIKAASVALEAVFVKIF
jgi:hypothetical protein